MYLLLSTDRRTDGRKITGACTKQQQKLTLQYDGLLGTNRPLCLCLCAYIHSSSSMYAARVFLMLKSTLGGTIRLKLLHLLSCLHGDGGGSSSGRQTLNVPFTHLCCLYVVQVRRPLKGPSTLFRNDGRPYVLTA